MNPYQVTLLSITAVAVAFSCWLVFCTGSAVRFAQSRSGSRIASEPWYPMWVRFEGIWMWAMIAFFLSMRLKG